jgi:hypothetical protein
MHKVKRYFQEIEYQREARTAVIVTVLAVIASIMLLAALLI